MASGRPQAARKRSWPTSPPSSRDQLVGAGVLPDDGVGDRLAARLLPHHRRLALVGDADRGDVGGARARLRPARRRPPPRRWPRSPRRRARPSPAAGRSAGAPSAPRPRRRRPRRTACSARRWCPGRWRRRSVRSWRQTQSRRSSPAQEAARIAASAIVPSGTRAYGSARTSHKASASVAGTWRMTIMSLVNEAADLVGALRIPRNSARQVGAAPSTTTPPPRSSASRAARWPARCTWTSSRRWR